MQARVVLETLLETFSPGELTLAPDYRFTTGPIYMEYGPATLDVLVKSQKERTCAV